MNADHRSAAVLQVEFGPRVAVTKTPEPSLHEPGEPQGRYTPEDCWRAPASMTAVRGQPQWVGVAASVGLGKIPSTSWSSSDPCIVSLRIINDGHAEPITVKLRLPAAVTSASDNYEPVRNVGTEAGIIFCGQTLNHHAGTFDQQKR